MKIKFGIIFCLLLLVTSCETLQYEGIGGGLVVEGWINSEGYPVVFVSRTIPATENEVGVSELRKYVEYFAKVKISDGEKEIMLVGKNDRNYYPSYQYTTSDMKGEVGKTYTITVMTENGQTASCKSKINKIVPLTSLRAVQLDEDTYTIEASFINSTADGLHYRFYVFVKGSDKTWMPSVLGVVDGSRTDGLVKANVNRGAGITGYGVKLGYKPGDKVFVRFCTMDNTMFNYWTEFENLQTIASNPLVPTTDNLPPVVDGAKGYWTGYGVYETMIQIPEK